MTKKLGLIGYPLTHSFSEKYFAQKFEKEQIKQYQYQNFELSDLEQFPNLLIENPDLIGLNVTIPYKEKVLKYVDYQSDVVKNVGAANTLVIDKDKKISAYNTDVYGFTESIKPLLQAFHKKALILGTGGAAKAVAYALKQLQIDYYFVSRTPAGKLQIGYQDLNRKLVSEHLIIINTTPLGTFPNVNEKPDFPFDFITNKHLFYDLIYNPAQTQFLKEAKKQGAITYNGLKMLQLQAEKSWKIWTKKTR